MFGKKHGCRFLIFHMKYAQYVKTLQISYKFSFSVLEIKMYGSSIYQESKDISLSLEYERVYGALCVNLSTCICYPFLSAPNLN